MQEQTFRFKSFSVKQGQCAMKVNTDGVLLGAWADVTQAKNILDIGTGTGAIALMTAQRNQHAEIDAIDIDETAYLQAKDNFANSPWSDRLHAYHSSLQDFSTDKKYDLIISNPPYFINDYKADDHQKNIARHSISLSYQDLIEGIHTLLSDKGKACLVLPVFNVTSLGLIANQANLYLTRCADVVAVEGKAPYLALIQLTREGKTFSKETIIIQDKAGHFRSEYKSLTADFYLKF